MKYVNDVEMPAGTFVMVFDWTRIVCLGKPTNGPNPGGHEVNLLWQRELLCLPPL